MTSVRKAQTGIAGIESYQGRRGVGGRALPEQNLVQCRHNPVPLRAVHAVTHRPVNAVGYRANMGTVALDIAQDDTREQVVLADSHVADIAAFVAVGGPAVNADC